MKGYTVSAAVAAWLSLLAAGVSAQSAGKNWNVVVGGTAGNVFTPASVSAGIGDTVTFWFQQKNHSVVQSSFDKPCALLEDNTIGRIGFDTDFLPVAANSTSFPSYTLTVTDKKPIWFYCKQADHCSKGMVGAVNPPQSGNTLEAFKSKAASVAKTDLSKKGSPFGGVGCFGNAVVKNEGKNITPTIIASTNGAPAAPPTPDAGANRKLWKVVVGGQAGNVFTPNDLTAEVGDVITFEFHQKNHSVVQAAFAKPCELLDDTTTGRLGFDTGFIPVSADATAFPTYNLTVTSKTPIWFYCKQADHCSKGMVASINAPKTGNTLEAFKAAAAKATTSLNKIGSPFGGVGSFGAAVSIPKSAGSSASPTEGASKDKPVDNAMSSSGTSNSEGSKTDKNWGGNSNPGNGQSGGQTHKIVVGGTAGNVFTPDVIHAKKGDKIEFEFHQKNHSVTQSSFDKPCALLDYGFDSDFVPVAADAKSFPSYTFTIADDSKPIWLYCKQGNHCSAGK